MATDVIPDRRRGNSLADFLRTARPEADAIPCAACGSPMAMTREGTYRMVLTDGALRGFNDVISVQRLFVENVESRLERANFPSRTTGSPHDPHRRVAEWLALAPGPDANGTTRHPQAAQAKAGDGDAKVRLGEQGELEGSVNRLAARSLLFPIDLFEGIENLDRFPRLDAEGDQAARAVEEVLIPSLVPRWTFGPLPELILEQREALELQRQLRDGRSQQRLGQVLRDACPVIANYLDLLEKKKGNRIDPALARLVQRTRLVLVILLGHKSPAIFEAPESRAPAPAGGPAVSAEFGLRELFPGGAEFKLPSTTVVPPDGLERLVRSAVLLNLPDLGLSPEARASLRRAAPQDRGWTAKDHRDLCEALFAAADGGDAGRDAGQGPAQVEAIWYREVGKLIHFACAHEAVGAGGPCGWFPKPEPTYPVVLLGSPGSSKSFTMTTGLSTFYDNAAAAGLTVSLDSPDDQQRMFDLRRENQHGEMPAATGIHERTSIKLSVEWTKEDRPPLRFVITDIAGEKVASMLRRGGSNSEMRRMLRNARTIVFFFDLSIEPAIRDQVTDNGQDPAWAHLTRCFDDVNQSRGRGADVSQLQLLEKLISELTDQRPDGSLRGTNFVCVLPKADLFVGEEDPDRFFLTPFFDHFRREGQRVFVPAAHRGDETFNGLCSLAGTGVEKGQPQILRELSDKAKECLLRIGSAFGPDADAAIRRMLGDMIDVRLISKLEKVFGPEHVFFLPVSAQGRVDARVVLRPRQGLGGGVKGTSPPATPDGPRGEKPNQKLTEYVFLAPVILAADDVAQGRTPGPARVD